MGKGYNKNRLIENFNGYYVPKNRKYYIEENKIFTFVQNVKSLKRLVILNLKEKNLL